jgi:uncharacterized protein (TIGR03000 family)
MLASLALSAAPARAQAAVNVYTGGIPTWYTWYGYPANMSYYYGPVAFIKPAATVQVAVPARPLVQVAVPSVPAREVAVVDEPVVEKDCAVSDKTVAHRDRAVVRLEVPADAQVWFQNVLTWQRGSERVFLSPPIETGQSLTYKVKATWKVNGRLVSRLKDVTVRPGRNLTVSFLDKDTDRVPTRMEELPRP